MPSIAAPGLQQRPIVRGECSYPRGEVGHVERAGDAVDQADADQEQQRGGEVDDDVVQPARTRAVPEPCSTRP